MGTTKRVAELILSAMPAEPAKGTKFVSVRFGNVLGSNGSVIPLFQAQIAEGGPVTVTHPQVRRYFMTIREAVQLVLQASTMGKGSEIFVLDMGDPVRILDLATNMIRLSGLRPDEDIEIRFIGLRPGEKLDEELITACENVAPTYHEKVKIFRGPRPSFVFVETWIRDLENLIMNRDEHAIVAHLKKLVPEYQAAAANGLRQSIPAHAAVG
jgi:FlaA1/EpsC-like NDP-sugar epimerase